VKPEIAEKWALALESGDYDQGTGHLIQNLSDHLAPKYCCLGVLCDLANKAGVTFRTDDNKMYGWNFGTNGATLPDCVIKWAGMRTEGGEYGTRPTHGLLVADNDSGNSFIQIAAIIREHVEDL
jgi:hypothetical protein